MRPILLNSCALAATTRESRFRIDAPIVPSRGTCVIALDEPTVAAIRQAAAYAWHNARFFTVNGDGGELLSLDGQPSDLGAQLVAADAAVMVAASDRAATPAALIGDACTRRRIMTAGVVLGGAREASAAVAALRPHARVITVTSDEDDLVEILSALRA